jgi:peptidoglycan/xylan/chitin deacetylase (PgdA/CDA1 family)
MPLTIVMYHYVRELTHGRYPGLKGITPAQFEAQLDYLQAHHTIVSLAQVLAHLHQGQPLPDKAALLTFDDGYLEHYTVVFPALLNRGLSGVFFPPLLAVRDRQLLPTNKIHILLAAVPTVEPLLAGCRAWMADHQAEFPDMASYDQYYQPLAVASRFDPAEVIFLKRLLQRELPEPARTRLVDALLAQVVGVPASVLANEWYLTEAQLRVMLANGMAVGSHGVSHQWLTSLEYYAQHNEIAESKAFLLGLGVPRDQLTICYPYGAFDSSTLELADGLGFRAGFSTEVRVAQLGLDHPLTLPRLDTVDLPLG